MVNSGETTRIGASVFDSGESVQFRPIANSLLETEEFPREAAFLRTLERAVFSYPQSPYLQLFRHAGCELEDVHNLVARDGLEEALRTLLEAVWLRISVPLNVASKKKSASSLATFMPWICSSCAIC